eukprot:6022261-Amphidinium_carterae.1
MCAGRFLEICNAGGGICERGWWSDLVVVGAGLRGGAEPLDLGRVERCARRVTAAAGRRMVRRFRTRW